MKIVTTKCTNTIPLGRLGENDYTLVRFDVSGWLAEYPEAVIGLYNQRPGDNSAYPVADLTVNGGVAEWQITNVELTQTGNGKCQLVAIKDSVVIKSMIYGTIVLDALDNSGDVPDPWDSWEDRFIELKGEAEQAASDAESAKDQILGMRAQAITLAPGSEATANYDDGVLTLGIPQGEQGAPGQDGAPGAKGDKGDKGDTGATGAQGQKGEKGDKGDKGDTGDQGQKGDKGDPGDPTELIDDNAGAGVTDKVWSASKSAGEVSDLLSAISGMEGSIAPVEASAIATSAHAVGELFVLNDTLLVALSAIAVGDTITTEGNSPNAAVTKLSEKLIKDIQVNGTSILNNGVANVPGGGYNKYGVFKLGANSGVGGLATDSTNVIYVDRATETLVKAGTNRFRPIAPDVQHSSAFYGLAKAAGDSTQSASSNAVGTYTEAAKSAISQMLTSPVSVSGTTPTITALAGIQYICGEVSTLDITLPASGCIDVVFDSGSTPTVLTITPPTGVTLKWANGFDPTALDANTTYEINIKDGLGVAGQWT